MKSCLSGCFEATRLYTFGPHSAEKTWPSSAPGLPIMRAHLPRLLSDSARLPSCSVCPHSAASGGIFNSDSTACGCSDELLHFSEHFTVEIADSFIVAHFVRSREHWARHRPCLVDSCPLDTGPGHFCIPCCCLDCYYIHVASYQPHWDPFRRFASC